MDLATMISERQKRAEQGPWYPASGGTETPFTYQGGTYLYCFQPSTGSHRYLDVRSDVLMPADWAPNA